MVTKTSINKLISNHIKSGPCESELNRLRKSVRYPALMTAVSLFMQGSAHASRASATSSHSKSLYGGSGGSPGTPTHNQTWV